MNMPTKWVAHEIHGHWGKGFHINRLLCGLDDKGGQCVFNGDSQRL